MLNDEKVAKISYKLPFLGAQNETLSKARLFQLRRGATAKSNPPKANGQSRVHGKPHSTAAFCGLDRCSITRYTLSKSCFEIIGSWEPST